MSESDDKLESFFQKAAQRYDDVNVREADWRRMEEKLDAELHRRSALQRVRQNRLWWTAVILVLLTATYFSWPFLSAPGDRADEPSVARQNQAATDTMDGLARSGRDLSREKKMQAADHVAGKPAEEETREGRELPALPAAGAAALRSAREEGAGARAAKLADQENKAPGKPHRGSLSTGGAFAGNGGGDNQTGEPRKASGENKGDDIEQQPSSGKDVMPEPNLEVAKQDSSSGAWTRDLGDEAMVEKARWYVSVVAAPDFSSTREGGYGTAGHAFGLTVQYRVTGKWAISAGALYSQKRYWGHGHEYHPPAGYWQAVTNGIIPDKIDGECAIIELPLSVSYTFHEGRRGRMFVAAGISSYLMRSEDYDYVFNDANPGAAQGWATEKPSAYWFGITNVSVGYDLRISPRVSLGAEPYLRLPLDGVGWANVKLFSTGLLVALRYQLPRGSGTRPAR